MTTKALRVDWAWPKAVLLFVGLLLKGLAMGDPLAIEYGPLIKQISSVVWMAFDGAFLWLLAPPKSNRQARDEEQPA
jgi:hypothetical protein